MKDINIAQEVNCSEVITSEEYADFLIVYEGDVTKITSREPVCSEILNKRYAIIYKKIQPDNPITLMDYEFNEIPQLLGLLDTSNLEAAGILKLHTQPYLKLRGKGVIVGLVDTGIDYTQSVFKNQDNTSKIINIWDQSIQGSPPKNFKYGTEYSREQINEALKSQKPFDIVPSKDELGHGTFLAGVAAGNPDTANDFIGAAPDAEIIMVKLKPAKKYIKDLYLINENVPAFEDIDIMQGVKYLSEKALELNRPIAILIGLGSNFGDHTGTAPIEEYINTIAQQNGVAIVVAGGNEANLGHHYLGTIDPAKGYEDVELKVGQNERGVTLQLWGRSPDLYSVSITSPGGEVIPEVPPRLNLKQRFTFLFEPTIIYLQYKILEEQSGDQLILLQLKNPTPGIWKIRVYSKSNVNGIYNMWIPREGFISPETIFVRSNPDITLTIPSTAFVPLTIAAYNHKTDSIYINSSRGYTRDGVTKPNLAAPGVNIWGPLPNNTFGTKTGTSVAAAHVTGAAALLLEWGIVLGNDSSMYTRKIKYLLVRGATRNPNQTYPNREWGYGTLNVVNSFESLK